MFYSLTAFYQFKRFYSVFVEQELNSLYIIFHTEKVNRIFESWLHKINKYPKYSYYI